VIVEEALTLWRPVGPQELQLIRQTGMRAFPPRLPEQPIFYPLLTEECGENRTRLERRGQRRRIRHTFSDQAELRRPLSSERSWWRSHQEYWIPAEDLEAFNAAIVGLIEVTGSFG
jgi:hypothetical protein